MDNGRGSLHAGAGMAMLALWALQYIYSTRRSDVIYLRFSLLVWPNSMRSGGFFVIVNVFIRIFCYAVVNSCARLPSYALSDLLMCYKRKNDLDLSEELAINFFLFSWSFNLCNLSMWFNCVRWGSKVVRVWSLKLSCGIEHLQQCSLPSVTIMFEVTTKRRNHIFLV